MRALLLVWSLMLAPSVGELPRARFANAIDSLNVDIETSAALLVVAFYENGLDPSNGVPFGACNHLCASHCGRCHHERLSATARVILGIWRRGVSQCGDALGAFAYLHNGACAVDSYAAMQERTLMRILRGRLASR